MGRMEGNEEEKKQLQGEFDMESEEIDNRIKVIATKQKGEIKKQNKLYTGK